MPPAHRPPTTSWTSTLHLAHLWARMETRAARTALTRGRTTTMPALALIPGHAINPARAAITYTPTDPYAVTVWVSVTDLTLTTTFARDLITNALTHGHTGYHHGHPANPVHVEVLNNAWTSVSFDTPTHGRVALALPTRRVRRAARTWARLVPPGTEHLDLTAITDNLTAP